MNNLEDCNDIENSDTQDGLSDTARSGNNFNNINNLSLSTQMYAITQQNTIPHFQEFFPLIPIYTGENPEFSVNDFLDKIEEVSQFADWRPEHKIFIVKCKLAGDAARFIRSQPQLKHTKNFDELKNGLLTRFRKFSSPQNDLLQFTTASQQPGEPISTYLSRLLGLAHKCFPNDDSIRNNLLVNQCLAGMLPKVRRFIMPHNPRTFEAIWELAQREEECTVLENNVAHVNAVSLPQREKSELSEFKNLLLSTMEGQNKKIEELADKIKDLKMQSTQSSNFKFYNRAQNKSGVTCFRCNRTGHIAKHCRMKFPNRENNLHDNLN